MQTLATVLVVLVAVLHVWILVLEMFLWPTRRGRQVFGTTREFARDTRALAANQGLYNGFLAAGLFWGAFADDPVGHQVTVFFLSCVVLAGIFGGATASRRIVVVQALPAALTLALVLATH